MSERRVATGKALCHITKGNFKSTLGTSGSLTTYLIRSKIGSNTGTCRGTFFDSFKFFDVELRDTLLRDTCIMLSVMHAFECTWLQR